MRIRIEEGFYVEYDKARDVYRFIDFREVPAGPDCGPPETWEVPGQSLEDAKRATRE